jgi:hypothetical protein
MSAALAGVAFMETSDDREPGVLPRVRSLQEWSTHRAPA